MGDWNFKPLWRSHHTEFVSWHVDHFLFFLFFPLRGVGGWCPELNGEFRYFFIFFESFPKHDFNVIIVLNSTLWVEEGYSRILTVVLHDLHGVLGDLGRHQMLVQGRGANCVGSWEGASQ